jgi:copper resistance protein B
MHRRDTSIVPPRSALLAALLLALPLAATAQSAPASSSSTTPMDMGAMPGMDHAGMHGMAMPATAGSTAKPATKAPVEKAKRPHAPATPTPSSAGAHDMSGMDHGTMPQVDHGAMAEMDHGPMHGMDHQAMPGMNHGEAHGTDSMPGMTMGPMQGGRAPADARSGDYSDGIAASPAHGLHMHGGAPAGMLVIDQLEAFRGRDANGQSWEIQGWYGNDSDKLWLRSEGERSRGKLEDGNVEAFWNRNVATFWSTQLGVRHDFGEGPARSWAAFGVQGLAPYWFELEATGYAGAGGRTAARLRAEYELLFTQRLILQPEAEINLYGKNDPQRRIGRGISDVQFGLRLRYEIRRQFAPYVGVNWVRRVGTSADYARQDRQPVLDRQIVAGVRIWF